MNELDALMFLQQQQQDLQFLLLLYTFCWRKITGRHELTKLNEADIL